MAHSLRARLLAWVMLPFAGAVVLAGVVGRQNAEATATVVQDRLLLGSARIVAEQLRFEDGSIQDPVPPAALELFQSGDIDNVYYRVVTSDGRTVTGYSEFQVSQARLQPETSQFFDTVVRGQAGAGGGVPSTGAHGDGHPAGTRADRSDACMVDRRWSRACGCRRWCSNSRLWRWWPCSFGWGCGIA